MRLYRILKFMTLVLISSSLTCGAAAAPTSTLTPSSPEQQIKKIEKTKTQPQQKLEMQTVSPSEVEPPPTYLGSEPLLPTRNMAQQAWTLSGGLWLGTLDENSSSNSSVLASFIKTNYNLNETAQEFGVQLTDRGRVGAQWGFKWLKGFAQGQEWFYKVGLGALYLPSENVGTLINYRRYYAQASVGLENVFYLNRHLRADITGIVGPIGASIQVNFGYAFEDWIF